jgi:hypothetical protein
MWLAQFFYEPKFSKPEGTLWTHGIMSATMYLFLISAVCMQVIGCLVRKLEGKRPLGKSRRKWEDNIKMNLRAMG